VKKDTGKLYTKGRGEGQEGAKRFRKYQYEGMRWKDRKMYPEWLLKKNIEAWGKKSRPTMLPVRLKSISSWNTSRGSKKQGTINNKAKKRHWEKKKNKESSVMGTEISNWELYSSDIMGG